MVSGSCCHSRYAKAPSTKVSLAALNIMFSAKTNCCLSADMTSVSGTPTSRKRLSIMTGFHPSERF